MIGQIHYSRLFPAFLMLFLLNSPAFPYGQVASAHAERILVFAPHPDDEVIGLGGFLSDKIREGAEVSVVLVTDGARFARAARLARRKPGPLLRGHDFRVLGTIRRGESVKALASLGVPEGRCIFLAYPGGSLGRILREKNPDRLIRCPATRQRFGIGRWLGKKRPPRPYSLVALEKDLANILEEMAPETCVFPSRFDSNEDHRAVSRLISECLAGLEGHTGNAPHVKRMCFLVHRGSRRKYPRPFGYLPGCGIENPPGLPVPERYHPTPEGIRKKEESIRIFRSQLRLRDGFLMSFIRSEELWWPE